MPPKVKRFWAKNKVYGLNSLPYWRSTLNRKGKILIFKHILTTLMLSLDYLRSLKHYSRSFCRYYLIDKQFKTFIHFLI